MADVINFPKEEQETSLAFYRDDKEVEVYTSDSTMITKLKKITDNYDVLTVNENGNITSAKFLLDIKQILFRPIPKKRESRAATEEERAILSERLAKARAMK